MLSLESRRASTRGQFSNHTRHPTWTAQSETDFILEADRKEEKAVSDSKLRISSCSGSD